MEMLFVFLSIVAIGITVATVPIWLPALKEHFRKVVPPQISDDVALVISLLDNAPDEWENDKYNLRHRALGVSMWIANGDYGLSLTFNGKDANPGSCATMSADDRGALYAAVKRYKEWQRGIATRDFAERVRAHMASKWS